jgi:hypothetical protein
VRGAIVYTHSGLTLFPAHLPESRRVWDRVGDRVKQPSGGYRRRLVAKRCWNFRDLDYFFNMRTNLTRSRFFCVCETSSTRPRFFGGVCGRFRQDLEFFFGCVGGGSDRAEHGWRKFQGNYETTVGGNDGTNWWATHAQGKKRTAENSRRIYPWQGQPPFR